MFSMFSKSLFVHVTMTAAVFHFCPLNLCPALAQTVEDQEEIVLGMSTALTGPAAELGLNVRQGFLAAIQEVNESGGIGGRRVRLISRDDGYEPSRTVPNMHTLVDEDRVLAVVGNVGTPTAVAAIPIAMDGQTPFYGAFTGAGVLRKTPPDRYVINYRASYADETRAMVDALIQNFGLDVKEIGFFTQRDSYGDAGFVGGIAALKRHGLKNEHSVAHGRYERNTLAIENGLADLLQADPPLRAVIMVGAYAPCAKFIQMASEYELNAVFLNVSFVGTAPLAKALGGKDFGVVVTQVVPHFDSTLPMVLEYRKALAKSAPTSQPTFGSLEGYIAGRILFRAMKNIQEVPTRENIIDALEGLGEFSMGLEEPLKLGKNEHQASHRVWPTLIQAGRIEPKTWLELSRCVGRRGSSGYQNARPPEYQNKQ